MTEPRRSFGTRIYRWLDGAIFDLGRQLRWSYLPPLMVYLASGLSGLTAIAGTFVVKDQFGFSAATLASLTFWAGIPWAIKVPLGHLVDLIWRWKWALVCLGAALITASIMIMYSLVVTPDRMTAVMPVEAWFVVSILLAPIGYVLQDVVADAMTVEAVPSVDDRGQRYPDPTIKVMHTTMQTLGRIAVIVGLVAVAVLNIAMFSGVDELAAAEKLRTYAHIYLLALAIPVVSVLGVLLGAVLRPKSVVASGGQGPGGQVETIRPNWWILGGGLAFVAFTLVVGLASVPFDQEIVFLGGLAIIVFLMRQLVLELEPGLRAPLIGTAIIFFVFSATPLPGDGATWWEIDVLGFDEQFLSVLTLIASGLALAGMIVLRPFMARRTIADIVLILTIAACILSLPYIGLFYGLHEWTARLTGGLIDARSIAVVDTTLQSPLAQISMVPLLAWIAKNAPAHLKATFFAVMASFSNLALQASSLGTRYLNQIFVIEREVRDRATGAVTVQADYSQLGWLLIAVAAITLLAPLITIAAIQASRLRTQQ